MRKVILAGTGPAADPGINKVTALTLQEILKGFLTRKDPKQFLYFTDTEHGRKEARAFVERLKERTADRDQAISPTSFRAQLRAIRHRGLQPAADPSHIGRPVPAANGERDRMVPSENTIDLAARLPRGELLPLYPDAGHRTPDTGHRGQLPVPRRIRRTGTRIPRTVARPWPDCTNAWKAWEEIVPLGYRGSYQRVRAYFRTKRLSVDPVTAPPPAPRTVAGWILRHPDSLPEVKHFRLKAVLAHCPELEALAGHIRCFAQILTERQGQRLLEWLDPVRQDDLPGLHTLAAASIATGPRSSPDSPCPGTRGSWKDTSTASRCSNVRCSAEPASHS
ncbi:alpha/beta fold hydrolase [Streptomyces sp. NPDC096205]|uniref:alpha/beta fold hydrolase n=1 Tax=Streptomyces sp. NPDC096205 TaxID=3366081 RepID=UPI0038061C8D